MPPFPSPAWVDVADRALTDDPTLAAALADVRISVGYVVDGTPAVSYRLEVGDGSARMLHGLADAAPILRTDGATARGVHDGSIAFTDAVLDGRLRIDGDATGLLAAKPALDAVRATLDRARLTDTEGS